MPLNTLHEIWRDAVPDLVFDAHGIEGKLFLNAVDELPVVNNPMVVEASFDGEPFKLFFEKNFVDSVFTSSSSGVVGEKISSTNAALVFEHIFTEPLILLEKILETKILIHEITSAKEQPKENGFGFSIHSMDNVFEAVFVCSDNSILKKLADELSPFQAPGEKLCSNICDVIIGPIGISNNAINNVEKGDLVSIGQKMDQGLFGYVVRESGTYWEVALEPSLAVIDSSAKKISDLLENINCDNLIGIKIGSIDIPASEVSGVKLNDSFQVDRIANNVVYLVVDGKNIASGSLQNVSDILCMAVNRLELENAD